MMGARKIAWSVTAIAAALAAASTLVPACSLGDGRGSVSGELDVPDCWTGNFDLKPDFFAAVPYRDTLQIRIQNGGDYETFSDGVEILIDDLSLVRNSMLGQQLRVSLPPEVTPPGVPVTPETDPPIVHLTLYLQRSCHTQTDALYALDEVTLNSLGQCAEDPVVDASSPTSRAACGALGLFSEAGAASDAMSDGATATTDAATPLPPPVSPPAQIGRSWIRFNNLFNGNPDESDASQRLNDGAFEVFLADPREVCPGGAPAGAAPPKCRGHLKGTFTFYFQRGKPAQPFP
jgi:hypothetical protein